MGNLTDTALRELDEMSAKGESPKLVSNSDLENKMNLAYFKVVSEYLDPRLIDYNSEESFDENMVFIG